MLAIVSSLLGIGAIVGTGAASQPSSRPATSASMDEDAQFIKCFEYFRYEFYIDTTDKKCKALPTSVRQFFVEAKRDVDSSIASCEKELASLKKKSDIKPQTKLAWSRKLREGLVILKRIKISAGLIPPPEVGYPLLHSLDTGNVGILLAHKVRQVVNDHEAIIEFDRDTLAWVKGISTGNIADGDVFSSRMPVCVTGNKQYTTVIGGSKTVMLLEPFAIEPYKDGITIDQFEAALTSRGLSKEWLLTTVANTKKRNHMDFVADVVIRILKAPERKTPVTPRGLPGKSGQSKT